MSASLPSPLSSLDERLSKARTLASTWLTDLWQSNPELVELLLGQAFDLNAGTSPPGQMLRQLTRGGAASFDATLSTDLPAVFNGQGALASHQLVGRKTDLESIFPGLEATVAGDEPSVLGFDRVHEDRFSGFTAGWSDQAPDGSKFLLNQAWAEQATVLELTEVLLEQAGHWLQSTLGLAEPSGDEGKIFAEGVLRLVAELVAPDDPLVVPAGTVAALRQRDDTGYLFASDGEDTPLIAMELGELSDQFFERFTRLLGNGEIPSLDLRASTAAALREAFGIQNSGVINLTPPIHRDSFASRQGVASNVYAKDESLLLTAAQVDPEEDLLRLVPLGSDGRNASPGNWDLNDFGFGTGDEYETSLSQPLVFDVSRINELATPVILKRPNNNEIIIGPDANIENIPSVLYAVPYWRLREPGKLIGYKLFEAAEDALDLFRELTAVAPKAQKIRVASTKALQLELTQTGAAQGVYRLTLNADRHFAIQGWQPESIREWIRIQSLMVPPLLMIVNLQQNNLVKPHQVDSLELMLF